MYTCEMHKHDVAYCHTLQTLIFWPLCLSEDCRKNEKKSSQTKREKGTNDTKVPLQGVISPHRHESCPLADSISRSIFQLPYPWGLQNDTTQRYQNDTHIRPFTGCNIGSFFDVSHRYLVKVPPRRSCFPLKKPFGAQVIFVEAILKRIRPLP